MSIVYARDTLACATRDGLTVLLTAGEPWDGDDPLVKHRPELFAPHPPFQSVRRTAGSGPLVEQATRAPGERRGRPNG